MSYMTDGAPLLFSANDMRGPLAQAVQDLANAASVGVTMSIYVDPVLGNDANAGTAAAPLATLQAALNIVPVSWRRKIRIYLAAGTYSLGSQFSWFAGTPIGVTSNTGPGALVDNGSTLDAGSFGIIGTGNTTYGVSCQHFGRMIANSNVTVTGTSGDALAGATAGTWAGIVGGTALTEAKSQTALIPNV